MSDQMVMMNNSHEDHARQSVEFADRSGDAFQRESKRTIMDDALHTSNLRPFALLVLGLFLMWLAAVPLSPGLWKITDLPGEPRMVLDHLLLLIAALFMAIASTMVAVPAIMEWEELKKTEPRGSHTRKIIRQRLIRYLSGMVECCFGLVFFCFLLLVLNGNLTAPGWLMGDRTGRASYLIPAFLFRGMAHSLAPGLKRGPRHLLLYLSILALLLAVVSFVNHPYKLIDGDFFGPRAPVEALLWSLVLSGGFAISYWYGIRKFVVGRDSSNVVHDGLQPVGRNGGDGKKPRRSILLPKVDMETLRGLRGPCLILAILCSPVLLGAFQDCPSYDDWDLETSHYRLEFRDPLERALWLGADWLLRDQNVDGSFRYEYDLKDDRYTPEDNIIRQAGTAYSTAYLYAYTGLKVHRKAAARAIDFLLAQLEQDSTGAFIVYNSAATLGATALGLVALCHYELATGSRENRDVMEDMASFIMAMQSSNGSFDGYYRILWYMAYDKHVSVYSGEALYALALMHRLTGKPEYRKAYDLALPWYLDFWDREHETMFYAWGAKAGYHMYLATGNASYAGLTWRMTDWIVGLQNRNPYSEGYGSYHGSVSIGTATYSEGVGDSLFLASALGNTTRIDRYSQALNMSARSILGLQVDPELAQQGPRPLRSLGGFRSRTWHTKVRIDHTQHAISAIMHWLEWTEGRYDTEPDGAALG